MKHFLVNDNLFYAANPQVKKNTFIGAPLKTGTLPTYESAVSALPRPFWEGHESTVACHDKAWQIGFGNLRNANAEAGFVSDFIDTAFNGYLFMWDSSFIVMFGKYGSRAFDFQSTLDNFYSHQHRDGFICREICESQPGEQFTRDDPASTGPNVLPWAEWEYYCSTADKERLARVFDPLCAYHRWLQLNRSWQDGSYYSCGLACGMDNQPRQTPGYNHNLSHGFMSWIDTCAQQYLSGDILCKMAKELGREEEVGWLREEADMLRRVITDTMWDEEKAFYFDKRRDGSLSDVKTVGAYWTLLAGIVPEERRERFIGHLRNPAEFARPNRIPTLSADDPNYRPDGGYWLGGVWAPTNYMVLQGLSRCGEKDLCFEIARDYLENVVKVFEKTGTVYENYAPESAEPGNPAASDFVGWTGLAPISILYEDVFGIRPDAQAKQIDWTIRLTDAFGIDNYPLGDATLSLRCEKRESESERPVVTIRSDKPVTVTIRWQGGEDTLSVPATTL